MMASALLHHGVGPLERRAVGQLRVHQDVALVFFGHEAAGDAADEHRRSAYEARR